MGFGGFFALAVVFFVVAPKQFVAMGYNIIQELTPIAHEGLVLAIILAALMAIVKSKF